MIRLVLIILLLSPPAMAGPWLRAKGDQFWSMTVESAAGGSSLNPYSSVYYEMGLNERWTVGLDAGSDILGYSSALLFARTSVWQGDRGGRVAIELGFGGLLDTAGQWVVMRPGISWGRGLNFHQGGWVSVDATYGYRPKDGRGITKIEGTLGLNQGKRAKLLLQITAEKPSNHDLSLSATPGIAFKIGKEYHLVAGAVFNNDQPTALKVGLWREF